MRMNDQRYILPAKYNDFKTPLGLSQNTKSMGVDESSNTRLISSSLLMPQGENQKTFDPLFLAKNNLILQGILGARQGATENDALNRMKLIKNE